MPELPEVEFARRVLTRWVVHHEVTSARVHDARIVGGGGTPASVARALAGRLIERVDRRGKWLRVLADDGTRLFSHFGMTGKWVRRDVGDPQVRFERARIDVAARGKTASIRYVDPRLLGRIVVANEDTKSWTKLGPDPLVDGIDASVLAARLAKRKKLSVKEALMDQEVIAGVGNIQATEALWRAKIDPRTKTSALTAADMRGIARAIDATIAKTLALVTAGEKRRGELAYVEEPGAPNPFAVYGRRGEPCPRCKTALVRIEQGGRSTVFCTRCQPRRARRRASTGSRR